MKTATSVKTFARVGAPLMLAGALLSVPTSAQAAQNWEGMLWMHGGVTQVCKQPAVGGWTIKVRMDNRKGNHMHRGSIGNRAGKWVSVQAGAGNVSKVKTLFTTRTFSVGIGDANGDKGAGDIPIADLNRC